jgi:hypothetical protein
MISEAFRRALHRARLFAAGLVLTLVPAALAAQPCFTPADFTSADQHCEPVGSQGAERWKGHATALGINAALGGVTAGVAQHLQGGSFWTGFVRGAGGGGVVYAGKSLAVADFAGAGFLGREISAVGSSMVANASDGRGAFDRVVLPVGPARLYVDLTGASTPVRAKVDLPGIVALAVTAADSDARLDLASSLSMGTPVFIVQGDEPWLGRARAGVVAIQDRGLPPDERKEAIREVRRHEQVHVLQYAFSATAWGEPLERRVLQHVPGGPTVNRYVDVGLHVALWGGLRLLYPSGYGPWEREALFLVPQQ